MTLLGMVAARRRNLTPPATGPETTGTWTTLEVETALWEQVAAETPLTHQVAGYSVLGNPIHRCDLGNPTGPTAFITGNAHGAERNSRDALIVWLRDHAYAIASGEGDPYFDTHRVVVIPSQNPDGFLYATGTQKGDTSEGVNISADWWEAQAIETRIGFEVFTAVDPDVYVDCHGYGNTTPQFLPGFGSPLNGPHPDITSLRATYSPGTVTQLINAGYTAADYSSMYTEAWYGSKIAACLNHCAGLLMEASTMTNVSIQLGGYAIMLESFLRWHESNASALQAAKAASMADRGALTVFNPSGTAVAIPAGTVGYTLPTAIPAALADFYGITTDGSGFATLDQPSRKALAQLVDEQSGTRIVNGTRVTT